MSLKKYGWSEELAAAMDELGDDSLKPARVFRASADFFRVYGEDFDIEAKMSGKLRHDASSAEQLPTVGDWVAVRLVDDKMARIERLLPRRTVLRRKVVGRRTQAQVVAANVDLVFVVMGLDGDFNVRRLERYLTAVRESGARPVVVLNKSDLCEELERHVAETLAVASGAEILVTCCEAREGVEALRDCFSANETAVLVGSSGVGKSTLINQLVGSDVQATRQVREADAKGRHTTTHRELFELPGGGLLIDSPGIRELQLWADGQSLNEAFDDVDQLAADCRFRDCTHAAEEGCAVVAAVGAGTLEAARLKSFRELQKELKQLGVRQSESGQREKKKKWRAIQKESRRFTKNRDR
jgi:ribosome biogenesis GTPase